MAEDARDVEGEVVPAALVYGHVLAGPGNSPRCTQGFFPPGGASLHRFGAVLLRLVPCF